jgi:DNA-binding transcriptional LysR family regulator
MDLAVVRSFIKVAELASFTHAAEHLGIPKSRVSLQIKALEIELGVRLLQRTTRSVRPTADGEQFLARATRLIAEADDMGAMFHASRTLRGVVRIDMPVTFARDYIIPKLPELYAQYPNIELQLSSTDRLVELVRDGFDCVLRSGALHDSGLVARRLGVLPMTNCASPEYIRSYGTPRAPADLDRHLIVHYANTLGAEPPVFEFHLAGKTVTRAMRSLITVNNVDAYHAACRAGLGIIQSPRLGVVKRLADKSLVELLPDHVCAPMPVSLLYAEGRPLAKRVRAVMAWLVQMVQPQLA